MKRHALAFPSRQQKNGLAVRLKKRLRYFSESIDFSVVSDVHELDFVVRALIEVTHGLHGNTVVHGYGEIDVVVLLFLLVFAVIGIARIARHETAGRNFAGNVHFLHVRTSSHVYAVSENVAFAVRAPEQIPPPLGGGLYSARRNEGAHAAQRQNGY